MILLLITVLFVSVSYAEEEVTTNDGAITINIYYSGKKGNAKKFVKEMEKSGTADTVRKEKGNIRYEYFYPANSKDTVLLIDSWESQQALDVHHDSPMMGKIAELRNKYDLHMKVERYVEDLNGI
ncbi:MAG: antibiotic biosynthesis monooxygenase, partial [Elusimicrobia bacterium]|nr:antibiotic biosynthesis monooxygenase [Elusimicrobiota bacterium]